MESILSMQQIHVGASTFEFIKRVGTSDARASDTALLARWGLTPEDALNLKKELLANTNTEKEFYNIGDMSQEAQDALQLAITRNIKDTIVEGNSLHNPSFIKTSGPIEKLIFQFLRFPLTAQTILLRRGIEENKAALFASMAGAFLSYGAMQYLIEQAKLTTGLIKPEDVKYDVFNNPQHAINLGTKSFTYMASIGSFSTAYDYLATLTPLPRAGSQYESRGDGILGVFGPTASFLNDAQGIAYKKLNGEDLSTSDNKTLQSWMMFMSLPGLKEALGAINDHLNK
jgi:hypothetical protein